MRSLRKRGEFVLTTVRPPDTPHPNNMPQTKKKSGSTPDVNAPLSPEADKFLADALAEFKTKQEALTRDWRFGTGKQWGFDQVSGVFKLDFSDGAEFQADGQILGSYFAARRSWEWAWNNPHVVPKMARDSKIVRQVGERLSISYLIAPMTPVPNEEFASYLAAIGVKATDSVGVYRGKAGPVDVFIALKNARWAKKEQYD